MSDVATKKEPFLRVVSPQVKVLFGFKDARAELRVMTPLKIEFPVTVPPDKVPPIKEAFDAAHAVAILSEEERAKVKETERVIEDRAKVLFGFPDGSGRICIRPFKLAPWIPIMIHREELIDGKKIMDEVLQWYHLPEEVRNLHGAP